MNGGIAYVLDRTGDFAKIQCNRASVDLEPVTKPEDIDTLKKLITRHGEYTGSPQAKWILANWDELLPKFVKVFPHEFKRVLGIPRTSIPLSALPTTVQPDQAVVRG
jgi:glutamate synthase domain-containing protein 3